MPLSGVVYLRARDEDILLAALNSWQVQSVVSHWHDGDTYHVGVYAQPKAKAQAMFVDEPMFTDEPGQRAFLNELRRLMMEFQVKSIVPSEARGAEIAMVGDVLEMHRMTVKTALDGPIGNADKNLRIRENTFVYVGPRQEDSLADETFYKAQVAAENALKEKMREYGVSDFMVNALYSVEVREVDGKIICTAVNRYSFDFYVGIGLTEEEAMTHMSPRLNVYDKGFREYENNLMGGRSKR